MQREFSKIGKSKTFPSISKLTKGNSDDVSKQSKQMEQSFTTSQIDSKGSDHKFNLLKDRYLHLKNLNAQKDNKIKQLECELSKFRKKHMD